MEMKDLLGGKGANLAEMTSVLELPVPPGFTISTDACRAYMYGGWPEGLDTEIARHIAKLEKRMGRRLGDPDDPLLVSVRSGAKFSMPGMMDTVLNLGLNDDAIEGLIATSGDARFAYDSYRRFIMMFSDITLKADYPGLSKEGFERILTEHKEKLGKTEDTVPISGGILRNALREEATRVFRNVSAEISWRRNGQGGLVWIEVHGRYIELETRRERFRKYAHRASN